MIQKAYNKSGSFSYVPTLNSIMHFKPTCSNWNGKKSLRVSALTLSLQAYAYFVPFCAMCFAELLYNLTKEIVVGKYFRLCV